MTRAITATIIAATLGACTLGACRDGVDKAPAPSRGSADHPVMSRDMARAQTEGAWRGYGDWYVVPTYHDGIGLVLVSMSQGVREGRLLSMDPKDGYEVSRISIQCPGGRYDVTSALRSDQDAGPPMKVTEGDFSPDIAGEIAKVCAGTARLPTFKGTLRVAVEKGRNLTLGLAESKRNPPPETKAAVLKGEENRQPDRIIRVGPRRP